MCVLCDLLKEVSDAGEVRGLLRVLTLPDLPGLAATLLPVFLFMHQSIVTHPYQTPAAFRCTPLMTECRPQAATQPQEAPIMTPYPCRDQ